MTDTPANTLTLDGVERAREIAHLVHNGQLDKGGQPYIEHVSRVADAVRHLGPSYETLAWLHDVVEDYDETKHAHLSNLEAQFGDEVEVALAHITRLKHWVRANDDDKKETYLEYILRLASNPLARRVKMSDLRDNLILGRIPSPTKADHRRHEKYTLALRLLETVESLDEF